MTTLAYLSHYDPEPWRRRFAECAAEFGFAAWPDEVEDPDSIEVALTWQPPAGALARFPNLKLVCNLGAGIDAVLADPAYPRQVPLVRLVDPAMTQAMSEYVVHWVLHLHRDFPLHARHQRDHVWEERTYPFARDRRVGILGLGEMGGHAARRLVALDFTVMGWSRTGKEVHRVENFVGPDHLDAMLAKTEILVNLLPLTPATEDILDARRLAMLPRGASIINCARGRHIVDADLLAALDEGHLAMAVLDAFRDEPLPAHHAFWDHPSVIVTPHIASLTPARTAARIIADTVRSFLAGTPAEALTGYVDPAAGY